MTPNEAGEVLYAAFAAAWAASAYSALAYGRDAVAFEPTPGTAYAAISIREAAASQDTLGATGTRRFERRAIFMVECAAPAGFGRRAVDAIARVVTLAFQGKSLPGSTPGDNVVCEVSHLDESGTDGQWFRILVSTPFRYYEQM